MIALDLPARPQTDSKILLAGYAAEKQMAYYLKRAFDESAYDYRVFNNLRLERRGMHAQIDHLVLHRYGFHLIESKSVAGTFTVDADGQFIRKSGRYTTGIASPIEQVIRQRDLLRDLLLDHKTKLRNTFLGPLKVQAGFKSLDYFNYLVAVSDHGIIKTVKCKKPAELHKADQVTKIIRAHVELLNTTRGVTGFIRSMRDKELMDKSLPPYADDEIDRITDFLLAQNQPESNAATPTTPPVKRDTTTARQPRAKANTPKIKKEVPSPKPNPPAPLSRPSNNMKRWSQAELDQVTQAFKSKTPAESVAAQLGRTPKAVRMRAQTLGLIESLNQWP